MKNILLLLFLVIILVSCAHESGSGNIIKETRDMGPFTGIDVAGGFEVELRNGATEKVEIEADDNLMKYVKVNRVGDDLKIRLEEINVSNAHLKVYVSAPHINGIKASASAEVVSADDLKGNMIDLHASSGSRIKVAVDAPEVKANASSGADLEISGRTKDLRAVSSSGSEIHALELLSENSYINASSGGKASVYASVSIDANASSGGSISYRGAATNVKKSQSSGGEVEKKD